MTEGVADSQSRFDFLHGHCHLLAVAMHRLSGLPIMAYVEPDFDAPDVIVLIHAFVLDGDHAVDARGRTLLGAVLDGFEYWDEELVGMTEAEVLGIGSAITVEDLECDPGYRDALGLAEGLLGERSCRP